MKNLFNVKQLGISGILILVSAFIAIVSLFFQWVKIIEFNMIRNGFQDGTFLFLLIYLYPIVTFVRNKKLKKGFGYVFAFLGILLGLSYMSMRTINEVDFYYRAWGIGPVIFTIASALYLLGVWLYKVKEDHALGG